MTKLLSIEGKTRPDYVRDGIIATLEDWIKEAKSGNIKSLMMIGVMNDLTSRVSIPANDSRFELLGAVEFAKHDFMEGPGD